MSGKNGTDVIDRAIDEVKAEAPAATGRLVSGEVDEFGVLPFGNVAPETLAEMAMTIQLQAGYIGRLQARIRELQALVDGLKAG